MNNKGFTLIELLAVIMVLSIIITISVSAYTSIQNSINDQQYENVISYIKTNAVRYAKENKFRPEDSSENKKSIYIYINVDGLIKRGYIEADDEAGTLKNPKDEGTLNDACIQIDYIRDNQTYEANVLDDNTICNNHKNNFPYIVSHS